MSRSELSALCSVVSMSWSELTSAKDVCCCGVSDICGVSDKRCPVREVVWGRAQWSGPSTRRPLAGCSYWGWSERAARGASAAVSWRTRRARRCRTRGRARRGGARRVDGHMTAAKCVRATMCVSVCSRGWCVQRGARGGHRYAPPRAYEIQATRSSCVRDSIVVARARVIASWLYKAGKFESAHPGYIHNTMHGLWLTCG